MVAHHTYGSTQYNFTPLRHATQDIYNRMHMPIYRLGCTSCALFPWQCQAATQHDGPLRSMRCSTYRNLVHTVYYTLVLSPEVLFTQYHVFHGSSKSSSSEEVPKEPPFWSSSPWSLSGRCQRLSGETRALGAQAAVEDDSGGVSVPAPSRTRHPPTRSAGRVWLHNGLRGKQS